jgi:pimeloyl-ACP methyl ester carboxylesterase
VKEKAVLFGKTTSLVGILTDPPDPERDDNFPVVILLNAGIVHRVGPNRLYVKMARELASLGFPVLRLDLSGIGDSPIRGDHLPFDKSVVSEIAEAMDYLKAARGVDRFVLTGICSGANLSYRTACCDPRVAGAILLNPRYHLHDRSDDLDVYIRNRTFIHHYFRLAFSSSFSAKIWSNIITGKVRRSGVKRAVTGFRLTSLFASRQKISAAASQAERDMRSLAERSVRLLHVYSEGDEGLDYLHVILGDRMRGWRASRLLTMQVIRGTDHTFTLLWSQSVLLEIVGSWIQAMVKGGLIRQ